MPIDERNNFLDRRYVNLDGDSMTGPLILERKVVMPLDAATKAYVDALVATLEARSILLDGSQPITGPFTLQGPPLSDLEAATKAYVDACDALVSATITTFPDDDPTPSVSAGKVFKTNSADALTITNFHDALTGQIIVVIFDDDFTTIQSSAAVRLQGGIDFTGAQYDVITLLYDGAQFLEVSRSLNT